MDASEAFALLISNPTPLKSFLRFLELTLGYTYDKDVGILQVSLKKNVNFIVENADNISSLFISFNENNMEFLTLLFLLIVCNDKKLKEEIGEEIFNQFLNTIDVGKLMSIGKKKKKLELDKKKLKPSLIYPLHYVDDSCYMDSSLVALLITQNSFVDENILYTKAVLDENLQEFRQELVKISKSLRGGDKVKNVTKLRSIIEKLNPPQPFYTPKTHHDASEFVTWIFDLFNVSIATLYQASFYSNNNKDFVNYDQPKIKVTKERPIIPITYDEIGKKKNLLSFFIKKNQKTKLTKDNYVKKTNPVTGEISRFKYMIQITKLDSPFYIFDVKRRGLRGKFNNTKIIAPEFIFMKNFKKLELSSIVIHTGWPHYVCVFKYNDDNWYYYDDTTLPIKKLGSYKDMIKKSKYDPFTNGTLFFYKSNLLLEDVEDSVEDSVEEDSVEVDSDLPI